MSCDKPVPGAGCVEGSPCAECGDSTLPVPVLPRCQDVSLTPGTYLNATVVVNASGCISLVTAGETPVYPDPDCCAPVGGGNSAPGGRGPKGDPGTAATVAFAPTVIVGATWALTNIGTPNAAILQLTVPSDLASGGGGGGVTVPPGAVTGDVCGLETTNGWVTGLPASIVTGLSYNPSAGAGNNLINVTIGPSNPANCDLVISIDVSALYANIQGLISTAANALQLQIDGLTQAVSDIDTRVDSIEAALLVRGSGQLIWNGGPTAAPLVLTEPGYPDINFTLYPGEHTDLPDSSAAAGSGTVSVFRVYRGGVLVHVYLSAAQPAPPPPGGI